MWVLYAQGWKLLHKNFTISCQLVSVTQWQGVQSNNNLNLQNKLLARNRDGKSKSLAFYVPLLLYYFICKLIWKNWSSWPIYKLNFVSPQIITNSKSIQYWILYQVLIHLDFPRHLACPLLKYESTLQKMSRAIPTK